MAGDPLSDPLPTDATEPSAEEPSETQPSLDEPSSRRDEGPGCLPAVMATTVLMGIFGFICCGISTWYLFQQRTEMAIRTLEGSYVPQLEQSLLDEETKALVVSEIRTLTEEMKRGKLENWQSAGVMQRIQRLPILQWGDLQATESFVKKNGSPEQITEASNQFKRIRLGTEQGIITSFDFYDLLTPVQVEDATSASGKRLKRPITLEEAMEVTSLAKLLADRENFPDPPEEDGQIVKVLKKEIQAGILQGTY